MDRQRVVFMLIYLFVDIGYVMFSQPFYRNVVTKIQGKGFPEFTLSRILGAIFSYACLAVGWLLIVPTLADTWSKKYPRVAAGALAGFTYGLVVYGVFNGTLHVMFDKYDGVVFLRDLLWGTSWATVLSALYMMFRD